MLNRFEIKIAIGTFVAAFICSVVDAHLSGGANLINWLAPFIIAAAAGGSAFFFARRPIARMITAKRQQKPIQLPEDLTPYSKAMDELTQSRVQPLQAELQTVRADLADYVAKELEFNLIHRIDDQLQSIHSTSQALERIITSICEDLQDTVVAALAFRQMSKDEVAVAASNGIDQSHHKTMVAAVTRSLPTITSSAAPIIWGKADLTHLAMVIPASTERVVIVPLKGTQNFMGCLMLCVNTSREQVIARVVRMMKKVGEHSARLLYRIALAEEKEENRRRDKLTQAWTRAVLSEKLLELTAAEAASNLSLLIIEGDNFIQLNQTIGRERGDELIKTLSDTIKANVKASRTSTNLEAFYRTGAAQFAILLENLDDTALYNVAERIRIAVSSKGSWPGDIAQWSVCVGAATPSDSPQPGALLEAAENALAYLRQQQSTNKILFANQLPAKFKRMRSADAGVAGDLQVFDPAELLQSMAIARNSGILRVTDESGIEFWAFFTDGNLKKAKLGTQLRGDAAVIEFICTFEHGNFRFVESNAMTAGGADDPRNLGTSYDTKDLNKLLLDSALAKDNFTAARTKVPNLELYVVAAAENQRPQLWEKLKAGPTPPSSSEIITMQEMIKLANGSLKLKQLMQKMDTQPTPVLYHCASMLLDFQLIRLTAIKTYAYM